MGILTHSFGIIYLSMAYYHHLEHFIGATCGKSAIKDGLWYCYTMSLREVTITPNITH